MTDPADPDTETVATSGRRPGRPGVTRDEVASAFEAWIARTGQPPSLRELRRALGHRGSMSTLGPLRRELLGNRLLAGEAPERGDADDTLIRAAKAAMALLAAEAAEAADEVIAAARRSADERVAAADARAERAATAGAAAALERERALGESASRQEALDATRAELSTLTQALDVSRQREAAVHEALTAARTEFAAYRDAAGHSIASLETRLEKSTRELNGRLETALAALEQSRHAHARLETSAATAAVHQRDALERMTIERDTLAEAHASAEARIATLMTENAHLDAALAVALSRADDALQRAENADAERATLRDRAERLDAVLTVTQRDREAQATRLDAVERTTRDLYTYAGRLQQQLRAMGVAREAIEPLPPRGQMERETDPHTES